jgi:predicted negative regulator of RcsB-dependent stress response
MSENSFQVRYDLTKKSKIKAFYESNKILIFSSVISILIILITFSFYVENKKKQRIWLSENYIQAKIYLEAGDKNKAVELLKSVIYENDATYSTLCFFLIMNQNLVTDYNELSDLFQHLLKNNKFSHELKNLILFKQALLNSNFVEESKLLEFSKLLINNESIWKPHILILLGDYFTSKGEYIKAIEFYQKIFTISNLHNDIYEHAQSQLAVISNE